MGFYYVWPFEIYAATLTSKSTKAPGRDLRFSNDSHMVAVLRG